MAHLDPTQVSVVDQGRTLEFNVSRSPEKNVRFSAVSKVIRKKVDCQSQTSVHAPAAYGSQPNFAQCLAITWAGRLYIHFRRLLLRNGIMPGAKFTLRPPSLALSYWQRYCTAFEARAVGANQTLRR